MNIPLRYEQGRDISPYTYIIIHTSYKPFATHLAKPSAKPVSCN